MKLSLLGKPVVTDRSGAARHRVHCFGVRDRRQYHPCPAELGELRHPDVKRS
jgi:hypothetical protein